MIPYVLYVIPIGVVFIFDTPNYIAYAVLTTASTIMFAIGSFSEFPLWAFLQNKTPGELIGKVMSLILLVPFTAMALGHIFFGAVFERFADVRPLVTFVTAFLAFVIAMYARSHFRKAAKDNVQEKQE